MCVINRQLNATLQPLRCYDNNVLQILPTQLIVFGTFGKDNNNSNNVSSSLFGKDLFIQSNGLHRWSEEIEKEIWRNLGIDYILYENN